MVKKNQPKPPQNSQPFNQIIFISFPLFLLSTHTWLYPLTLKDTAAGLDHEFYVENVIPKIPSETCKYIFWISKKIHYVDPRSCDTSQKSILVHLELCLWHSLSPMFELGTYISTKNHTSNTM